MIQSNANLGVHGQGFLNLSGPGDMIEAQRLILSLFFSINVSWMFSLVWHMNIAFWNQSSQFSVEGVLLVIFVTYG